MIFIVNADNRSRFEAELSQMHRHRKAVFVDQIGWPISVAGDREIDAYDRADTVYLIAQATCKGPVLASARLLPTTRPHLMSDVFAHACSDGPPRGPAIWEASRFCAAPSLINRRERLHLLWEIFCGVTETALLFGIDRIVFTANAALLPLALRCGWRARRLGPTLSDGADQVTAVGVDVEPAGLRAIRRRFDIPGPVTRFVAPSLEIAA